MVKKVVKRRNIKDEHWFQSMWRPAMAWLYMLICAADFLIFPTGNMILSGIFKIPYTEWHPITLVDGGLIHLSFGAILGITAWSRGQDKLYYGPSNQSMGYGNSFGMPTNSFGGNRPFNSSEFNQNNNNTMNNMSSNNNSNTILGTANTSMHHIHNQIS
jgi:hypothetical protein